MQGAPWGAHGLIGARQGDRPVFFMPVQSMSHDGIYIARGTFAPNPGVRIGSPKLVVTVHEGEPFEMEWHEPNTGRHHKTVVRPGAIQVWPADRPFYQRWSGRPCAIVMAFDRRFVDAIGEAFGGKTCADIDTVVDRRDTEIEAIATRLRRELIDADPAGPFVAEGFAKALLVHVFRMYPRVPGHGTPVRGGLERRTLARVLDYIDDHLTEKITLGMLAAVAGLSSHYFSEAFKKMTGLPPIRFVTRQRVEKAMHYLATTDWTIADIAHFLGFPSHGHLSTYFKRIFGAPPSRFRSEWRRNGNAGVCPCMAR